MADSSRHIIQKVLRNKGGLFGAVTILLACLIALFAYQIAPDNSNNANRMIPEIGSKPPGFTILMLLLPKTTNSLQQNSKGFLSGKADIVQYIPITRYQLTADSIVYERYIDEALTRQERVARNQLSTRPIVKQTFYLGTDKFGRDMLSRLLLGTRVSLSVGLIAVLLSLTIGIALGAIAGYFGGKTDVCIMWLINVVWSIPTLLLVFAITLLLGKGFWQVFIAVGLTMWINVARLVRGQVMAIKEQEFIEATKALGFSHTKTIVKHILPNIIAPILVIAAGNFAGAIVMEAGLSFLGVGVQPPQPSWGLMMKENYNFIITNNPVLALAPGIAIMLLVLAFNLLGNALRDAVDVKQTV
jgi:ABC-type dipeptide/oligopeptide/nickel transport system permease subunit